MKENEIAGLTLYQDNSVSLKEQVFRTLRDAILEGRLTPGTRLMELHLADQLEVSRTPVREAIHRLAREGLVEEHPHSGNIVAGLTAADLRDVLELREVLEELAVRKACRNMDEETLKGIRDAEAAFEKTIGKELKEKDFPAFARADERFHEKIYEAARNRKLKMLLFSLRQQIFRCRMESLRLEIDYEHVSTEHNALIRAFAERDEEKAAKTIRRHIEGHWHTLLGGLEEK